MAHHGAEGSSSSAAVGAAITGSQVLALKRNASRSSVSDSLWGNLLLSMAYQRDPIIQKYARRLNRVNTFTLLSIAGVSGLGLAQSISAYNNTDGPLSIDITPAHHPGGHDHVHIPGKRKTPATLGIVGSGATLATLGVKAILDHRYSHRLAKRQEALKNKVEQLLSRLEAGEKTEVLQPELAALVGPRATQEFIQIWLAVHPPTS